MNYTLKSFNTGQITLPKKWRSRFRTVHYIAQETENGLLIQPIENPEDVMYKHLWVNPEDVEFREDEHGASLVFKNGVDAKKLLNVMKKSCQKIS